MIRSRLQEYKSWNVSATSPPSLRQQGYDVVAEQLGSIEDAINQLQREKANWMGLQNELSLVFRLHDELIAYIFTLLMNESLNSDPPSYHWILVTHVCRKWREISLNHANLWIRPRFDNMNCAVEMLKRAKGCPVMADITATTMINGELRTNSIACRLAADNMHLVQTLKLRESSFFQSDHRVESVEIFAPFRERAPQLRRLDVSAPPYWTPKLALPDNIFLGDCKNLKVVHLFGWHLPRRMESPHSFAQITSLSIVMRWRSAGLHGQMDPVQLSNDQIITSIQQLGALRTLILGNALRPPFQIGQAEPFSLGISTHSAKLPDLKICQIDDYAPNIHHILAGISLSECLVLRVGLVNPTFTHGNVLDRMVEVLGRTTEQQNDTIVVFWDQGTNHSIISFQLSNDQELRISSINDALTFREPSVSILLGGVIELETVGNLRRLLPHQDHTSLYYSHLFSSTKVWREFGQLDCLSRATLERTHPTFLWVLSKSGDPEHPNYSLFPKLGILLLSKWTFEEKPIHSIVDTITLSDMETCLTSWSLNNVAREISVTFCNCDGINQATMERLNTVTPTNHTFTLV